MTTGPPARSTTSRAVLGTGLLAALLGLQIAVNVGAFTGEVFAYNGDAAQRSADRASAAWFFERAVAWSPYHYEFLYKLGAARLQNGAPEAAVAAFRESLRRGPDNIPALLALAQAEARLGRLDGAEEALSRARRIAPRYWKVALMAGHVALLAGDVPAATARMEEALSLPYADRGAVLMPLAGAYLAAGDAAKGLACADEAAALGPDNPVHLLLRGRALLALGCADESLVPLKAYIERSLKSERADLSMFDVADGFASLAEAYSATGNAPAAADVLPRLLMAAGPADRRVRKSALELAARLPVPPPDTATAVACAQVGFTLGGLGEPAEAERLLRAAAPSLDGHHRFSCLYNLGVVLTKLGRAQEALEPLREAISLDPDQLQASLAYANALADAGDIENARATYNALLQDSRLSDNLRSLAQKRLATLPGS